MVSSDGEFLSPKGKILKKTYKYRKEGRRRAKINLCIDGVRCTKTVARLVLSAKLGRELEPWEDCCHIDGDPTNDCMENLKASCRLNNIIDEIELGRIETTRESLQEAVNRLQVLLDSDFTTKIRSGITTG